MKFSSVETVNDLLEWDIQVRTKYLEQIDFLKKFYEIRKSYKQISLTMDYDSDTKGCMSPMMWGIYADKSKGVCIELDYNKIKFPEDVLRGIIHYKRVMERGIELDPTISSSDGLTDFILHHKKQIMFTKHISWAGENEYRVMNNNDKIESLYIKDAITNVYLRSSKNLEEIEHMVGDSIPIMYFGYKKDEKSNRAIPFVQDIYDYKNSIKAKEIPIITITDPLLKAIFHLK